MQNAVACAVLIMAALSSDSHNAHANEPVMAGKWRVEYTLPGADPATLQLEVMASGKASIIHVGAARSSLSPPLPGPAVWKQVSNRIEFSGELNLPIGNVGVETVTLTFTGTLSPEGVMTGSVTQVQTDQKSAAVIPPPGKFRATQIDTAKVR